MLTEIATWIVGILIAALVVLYIVDSFLIEMKFFRTFKKFVPWVVGGLGVAIGLLLGRSKPKPKVDTLERAPPENLNNEKFNATDSKSDDTDLDSKVRDRTLHDLSRDADARDAELDSLRARLDKLQ